MSYNFRSKLIFEELLKSGGFEDEASESEEGFSNKFLKVNMTESSDDEDLEDASFDQRLLQTRSRTSSESVIENSSLAKRLQEPRGRGRPQYKLKGKNNYSLDTRATQRNSGILSLLASICTYEIYIYLIIAIDKYYII